jgi:hypothetical protein
MNNMEIANTIKEQLGGHRFVVMTGANTFTAGDRNLTFRIPKAKNGINIVRVTLEADDYKVEFLRVRGVKVTTVLELSGIYAENLAGLFEAQTGLYTSLGTMGRR